MRFDVVALAALVALSLPTDAAIEARPAADAADALMSNFYDETTGQWGPGWWNSGNALTALLETMRVFPDIRESYESIVPHTYVVNLDEWYGNYTSNSIDDSGWWALAWLDAFRLLGDNRMLETSIFVADFMDQFYDDHCNGGIWSSDEKEYKNAVTNSLFLQVNAGLYRTLDDLGDDRAPTYLQRALDEWFWFKASGMINEDNLINDGIDYDTCENNHPPIWSYNQGVVLAGLVELHLAAVEAPNSKTLTGDLGARLASVDWLAEGRALADASTTYDGLNPIDGILAELCEFDENVPGRKLMQDGDCGADAPSFKGIYVRDLRRLNNELSDHPYTDYLLRQGMTAYKFDRTDGDLYGLRWRGPIDQTDHKRQQSALDLMNAITGLF